ncbi:penicillin-binding transpeptidase domain-containing protein, partial [Pseudomonadales bacterium]|nr:penicillin-binding transpeptidase domain-containing protein [Pseudomonadales bacterium]
KRCDQNIAMPNPKIDGIARIPGQFASRALPCATRQQAGIGIGGMEKVVHRGNQIYGENGTAWSYIGRDIEYRMAGKSGTAQVVAIEQGEVYEASIIEERKRKHAWFIAFAPIEDPKIALAVLLENGGGGSEYAAPVAREIIDYYLLEGAGGRVPDVAMARRQ